MKATIRRHRSPTGKAGILREWTLSTRRQAGTFPLSARSGIPRPILGIRVTTSPTRRPLWPRPSSRPANSSRGTVSGPSRIFSKRAIFRPCHFTGDWPAHRPWRRQAHVPRIRAVARAGDRASAGRRPARNGERLGHARQGSSYRVARQSRGAASLDRRRARAIHLTQTPEPSGAWVKRIDEHHANPKRRWQALGSPEYLDRDDRRTTSRSLASGTAGVSVELAEERIDLEIELPAHAVAAVTVEFAPS